MSRKRRRHKRSKKRLSCELEIGDRRFWGVVLDVSAEGMFVQTSAKPTPGEVVQVHWTPPGAEEGVTMDARVARARVVPPQLRAVAQGGIGLHFKQPAKTFRDFVARVEKGEETLSEPPRSAQPTKPPGFATPKLSRKAPKKPEPEPEQEKKNEEGPTRFRVRVGDPDSVKCTTYLVAARTAEQARQRVVSKIGDSSKIQDIEPA